MGQGTERMVGARYLPRAASVLTLVFALSACSATYRNYGYVPPQEDLDQIAVGIDTRSSVEETLGATGASSVLEDDALYFVRSRVRSFALFEGVEGLADVQRLSWFSQGFIKAGERDEQVVITDLRMGYEGNYVFNHVVARVDGDGYRAVKSELVPVNYTGDSLSFLWKQMTAP